MKNKTKIIIEHGNKKYEVLYTGDCTRRCSFVKHDRKGACEDCCRLPHWFTSLIKTKWENGYLREISGEMSK